MADPTILSSTPWEWIVPLNTIFIAATAIATWIWTRGGKEAVLRNQVESGVAALRAANERADKSEAKYDVLIERLHEHMVADAAAFAKLEALASETARSGLASELRLTNALDNLSKRIDGMAERFDDFLSVALSKPTHGAQK